MIKDVRRSDSYNESLHKSELSRYRVECAGYMTGCVLDVGGGLGSYLPYFNAEHVTILDNDKETLDRLQHDDKVFADATELPFKDNSFDNVWACAVCQYFDIDKFIGEAKRVTKEGGYIYILVPNAKSPWDKVKRLLGMRTWEEQEGIYRQYTVDELMRYGDVTGEIKFLPFERLWRKNLKMAHTLMLKVKNGKDIG